MSTPMSWEEALDRAAQKNGYPDFDHIIDHEGLLPPNNDGIQYINIDCIIKCTKMAAELFAKNAWDEGFIRGISSSLTYTDEIEGAKQRFNPHRVTPDKTDFEIMADVVQKWGNTHDIQKVWGTHVDLTQLPDGVSICYGDGATYYFQLTKK